MSRFPFWSDEPFELSDAEWATLSPRELNEYNHAKRRWRLAAARLKGTHTPEEWSWIKAACGFRCVRCGRDDVPLEKDHIHPIFCGGSDGPENLQPLCKPCNTGKQGSDDLRPPEVREALGLI